MTSVEGFWPVSCKDRDEITCVMIVLMIALMVNVMIAWVMIASDDCLSQLDALPNVIRGSSSVEGFWPSG